MHESQVLTATLKRCLRNSGLTYHDVADELDLSEASVKRVFSKGTFTVDRMERICALMNMRISDLCRLADKLHADNRTVLSREQEKALASSPSLLRYFYRLLTGWSPARINRTQGHDEYRATQLLAKLDRLRLLELQPANKVRLLVGPHIAWRQDGPLWRRYATQVQADFMNPGGFQGDDTAFYFETGELSAGSIDILGRKLALLTREFLELTELDSALRPDQRRHVGIMMGLKPWLFSPLFADESEEKGGQRPDWQ